MAKTFEKQFNKSIQSPISRSSRRFLFNHLNDGSFEVSGKFHVDMMFGAGSGTLLKYGDKFFLLTARHVIVNNIGWGLFQNESPFWVPVDHRVQFVSLYDYLMPKFIWEIGSIISNYAEGQKLRTDYLDISDVVIVELFQPPKYHFPKSYIDANNSKNFLRKELFEEDLLLCAAGYAFKNNEFDYSYHIGQFTHKTDIQRNLVLGAYKKDDKFGHISFVQTLDEKVNSRDLDGMSGCPIHTITKNKSNEVKFAGMALTAGENMMRFIPSYLIDYGIRNHHLSNRVTVDPRAEVFDPIEAFLASMIYDYEYSADETKKVDLLKMLKCVLFAPHEFRIDVDSPILVKLRHIISETDGGTN